ncbi:MAG TPA: hypothetical protein VLE47_04115 [Candidatus Saccharimonadales bacterium]|nr:hypothetical protein [Candidatus Saccharimonadales bacterium]
MEHPNAEVLRRLFHERELAALGPDDTLPEDLQEVDKHVMGCMQCMNRDLDGEKLRKYLEPIRTMEGAIEVLLDPNRPTDLREMAADELSEHVEIPHAREALEKVSQNALDYASEAAQSALADGLAIEKIKSDQAALKAVAEDESAETRVRFMAVDVLQSMISDSDEWESLRDLVRAAAEQKLRGLF